ncbi:Metallo-dependent phosphatase-like protein [Lyophyllum atratum]|nr:Metallo-dependent phosphatase-like protein [Lyophyllum atratum]
MNYRMVVVGLRITWILIIIWYELGVFFSSVRHCYWPDSTLSVSPSESQSAPSHVLLIADPQVLDHRSYPERGPYLTYLTQLVVDLNLRKNWWAALRKRPDAVIFLGDMMDGGRFDMSDDEYELYYRRFKSIFTGPTGIPTYFLPGNHDIGLQVRESGSFSPHAHTRYLSHFGPLNRHVTIANHTFVLLDAPSLVEEDNERANHAKTYTEWIPRRNGPVELVKSIGRKQPESDPVVLLSHIPLSRDTYNCGPLREKGTIRPGIGFGYQNTLGEEVTTFLLEELRPSVVFSGDDHDYCEINHTSVVDNDRSQIREVSIKSLSMAMGIKRPGFQLLSLAQGHAEASAKLHRTHADAPCLLPDQIAIYISVYIPLLLVSLFVVLVSNMLRVRSFRTSTRQHRRRSSSPRLRSTIRTQEPGDLSEDEPWHDVSYLLPQPPFTPLPKPTLSRRQPPFSFVMYGGRRRIMCPEALRRIYVYCMVATRTPRQQRSYGLWGGFIRDARDIAAFPLTVFIVISWWMTFC